MVKRMILREVFFWNSTKTQCSRAIDELSGKAA